jgi:hypothetical protein
MLMYLLHLNPKVDSNIKNKFPNFKSIKSFTVQRLIEPPKKRSQSDHSEHSKTIS